MAQRPCDESSMRTHHRALLDLVVTGIEDTLTCAPQPFKDSCSDEFPIGRGPLLGVIVLADGLIGVGAADRRTFGSEPVGVTTQNGFSKTPRSALNLAPSPRRSVGGFRSTGFRTPHA